VSLSIRCDCHYNQNLYVQFARLARPPVADGGDGLQMRRVASNILNKQSRTADRGWPSSLVVGRGVNNPPLSNL
jgi:hypothetical protein